MDFMTISTMTNGFFNKISTLNRSIIGVGKDYSTVTDLAKFLG